MLHDWASIDMKGSHKYVFNVSFGRIQWILGLDSSLSRLDAIEMVGGNHRGRSRG